LPQKNRKQSGRRPLVNRVIYKNTFGVKAMLDTEVWRNNPMTG